MVRLDWRRIAHIQAPQPLFAHTRTPLQVCTLETGRDALIGAANVPKLLADLLDCGGQYDRLPHQVRPTSPPICLAPCIS